MSRAAATAAAASRRSAGATATRLALAVCLSIVPAWALADTWLDLCDTPSPAWEPDAEQTLQRGGPVRLLKRERLPLPGGGPQRGAEHIAYQCPPGLSAWLWREAPPAALIDELRVTVACRASRPGMLLAAEVVLPRSIDAATGRPLRLVIRQAATLGASAGDALLRLDNFPAAVARQARVERLARLDPQSGALNPPMPIDERGAYLARVAIAAPGDPQPVELWITELRIEGLVAPPQLVDTAANASTGAAQAPPRVAGGRVVPTVVTLGSDGFRIDDNPFFPRVWAWRGEPLAAVRRAGFNAVWLENPPTRELLDEAALASLRVLAPPPDPEPAGDGEVGWGPVLAWVVPGRATPTRVDAGLAVIEAARSLPPAAQRPVLVRLRSDASPWRRLVDGVVVETVSSRAVGVADTARTLRGVAAQVGPTVPLLAMLDATVAPTTLRQIDALTGEGVALPWLTPSELAWELHGALGEGTRGVVLRSSEPLSAAGDASAAAVAWLAVLNSHLRLVDPWLAGCASPSSRRGDTVLFDRMGVRLALGPLLPPPDRFAIGREGLVIRPPEAPLELPGQAGAATVLSVSPAAVVAPRTSRSAGALVVERDPVGGPVALVLSDDPRVAESLRGYARSHGSAWSSAWISLAASATAAADSLSPQQRAELRRLIGGAHLAAARRDWASAYGAAREAVVRVESASLARRAAASGLVRRPSLEGPPALESSPLAILPATLADHFRLAELVAVSPRGPNRLYGGSFEDLAELRDAGWKNLAPEAADAPATLPVELAPGDAKHGQRRLRLVGAVDAPLRVASPELELAPDELLEVVGWLRVVGGDDGALWIEDSLGGRELALRAPAPAAGEPAAPWRPFRLLRRADDSRRERVELRTEGSVIAEVDAMMIRAILPGPVKPGDGSAATAAQATAGSHQWK